MNQFIADQVSEKIVTDSSKETMDNWFVEMIDHLKTDHFMLETNSAPKEKAELYQAFFEKNHDMVFSRMRNDSSHFFIESLVFDYLNELKAANKKPIKLALGISDSKILVWSEIADNDEEMEDLLLLTEAKVNGKYHSKGFYLNSTIVEHSDFLPIPPHYQNVL